MKVLSLSMFAIVSLCLFSCGTLVKKDSNDNSLVILKMNVNGPLSFDNIGEFSLLNIDTMKVYSSNFTANHYSMIGNIPKGRYVITQLWEPIQTGKIFVNFQTNSSEIIRDYRMNGIYGLIPAINKTTNDIIKMFEIKEPGVYYLGYLYVNVEVGINISNKYNSEINDKVDQDIKKILKNKDWSSDTINSLKVFSKEDFKY